MRSGLKAVLMSPVLRAQQMQGADRDLQFIERITPLAQTDPEIGMALNKHKGLKSTAAKLDVSPDWFRSKEEYNAMVQQAQQAEQAQAQADTARTLSQAYQAAARGTSSLQQQEGGPGFLQALIDRGAR